MPAETGGAAASYAVRSHDAVRSAFETGWFGRLVPRLLREAGGCELLDLGCGCAEPSWAAADTLTRYVGVDLDPPTDGRFVQHDLRDGLGPVGARPFHLYLGTFGIASHLAPAHLRRLLGDIAAHARPGAIVAIEALGLFSLEWPRLWGRPAGPARTIPYRLAADVEVHPWAPGELGAMLREAGIDPLRALDRTLQAGPKTGEGRYWPALPAVRGALNALLAGDRDAAHEVELSAPLPPLPAGPAALVHHTLAARRRALATAGRLTPEAIWALEPPTGDGLGHGLLVVGRVR